MFINHIEKNGCMRISADMGREFVFYLRNDAVIRNVRHFETQCDNTILFTGSKEMDGKCMELDLREVKCMVEIARK